MYSSPSLWPVVILPLLMVAPPVPVLAPIIPPLARVRVEVDRSTVNAVDPESFNALIVLLLASVPPPVALTFSAAPPHTLGLARDVPLMPVIEMLAPLFALVAQNTPPTVA